NSPKKVQLVAFLLLFIVRRRKTVTFIPGCVTIRIVALTHARKQWNELKPNEATGDNNERTHQQHPRRRSICSNRRSRYCSTRPDHSCSGLIKPYAKPQRVKRCR